MKDLTKFIGVGILPILLLITSCSIDKRVHRKGFHITSSIFKTNQKLIAKETLTEKKEISRKEDVDDKSRFKNTEELINMEELSIVNPSNSVALASNVEHSSIVKSLLNGSALKNDVYSKRQTPNRKLKETRDSSESFQKNPQRRTAIVIGGSLLLMAVLAGVSIPALGTLAASIGLIGIFLLDVLVSLGIVKYHKKEKPKLAKASGLLRILYSAILGVAVGYHLSGSVSMFNSVWGIGLIFFGIHLISLGLLYDNEGGKKWVKYLIKSLLILAGIGYIIMYVGILLVPNPIGFAALIEPIFIVPMILGEVFYALWMLFKGGKEISNHSETKLNTIISDGVFTK